MVANVSDEEMQEHYDNFFEDVFVELEDKYGEIEEMNVCDNLGDHLVGNVYIKFRREEDAERAAKELNNRWFGGRPVYAELSPVTGMYSLHQILSYRYVIRRCVISFKFQTNYFSQQTSVKLAVVSMKWENVLVLVSAISCT